MTRKIYKYEIPISDQFNLEMPIGSKLLHFGTQFGKPTLWAEVNTDDQGTMIRAFAIYGTGHVHRQGEQEYVGTVLMENDALVWHLYERL